MNADDQDNGRTPEEYSEWLDQMAAKLPPLTYEKAVRLHCVKTVLDPEWIAARRDR